MTCRPSWLHHIPSWPHPSIPIGPLVGTIAGRPPPGGRWVWRPRPLVLWLWWRLRLARPPGVFQILVQGGRKILGLLVQLGLLVPTFRCLSFFFSFRRLFIFLCHLHFRVVDDGACTGISSKIFAQMVFEVPLDCHECSVEFAGISNFVQLSPDEIHQQLLRNHHAVIAATSRAASVLDVIRLVMSGSRDDSRRHWHMLVFHLGDQFLSDKDWLAEDWIAGEWW